MTQTPQKRTVNDCPLDSGWSQGGGLEGISRSILKGPISTEEDLDTSQLRKDNKERIR